MDPLPLEWLAIVDLVTFAFQPIVDIRSYAIHGVEALLRGWEAASFSSIQAIFDRAYAEGVLYSFDFHLRRKALGLFLKLPLPPGARLFYNLDNRIVEMPDYGPGNTTALLEELGVAPYRLVFEVSERHEFSDYADARTVLDRYRRQDFRIALDDFGAGYSGLQLLFFAEPDIVKIDRFFIGDIDRDARKRLFVAHMITMAHLLGLSVLAEGIETEGEFEACRRIGCDLAQGYYIGRPALDGDGLPLDYPLGQRRFGAGRRAEDKGSDLALSRLSLIAPVRLDGPLEELLARFKDDDAPSAIPVLAPSGDCVGVFRERDFRRYVYSPFGISLLEHAALDGSIAELIARVPVVDRRADLGAMKDVFLGIPEADGVVVMECGRYQGYLDARSLLAAITEKQLQEARDQNPLSRLPGNGALEEYFSRSFPTERGGAVLAYFDFNGFKAFNDRYGFRRGDRVILLFADILRDLVSREGTLVSHIGGDDFFAKLSFPDLESLKTALLLVREVQRRFAGSSAAFYDEEDRIRGYLSGTDRQGRPHKFPLLSACAAVIVCPPGEARPDPDSISGELAALKKRAKALAQSDSRVRKSRASVGAAAGRSGPLTDCQGLPLPADSGEHGGLALLFLGASRNDAPSLPAIRA